MSFIKWWLKNIQWKKNLKTFFISLIAIILYLSIMVTMLLSQKYKWAEIVTYIIIFILVLFFSIVIIYGIKDYFDKKKNEYKHRKEE